VRFADLQLGRQRPARRLDAALGVDLDADQTQGVEQVLNLFRGGVLLLEVFLQEGGQLSINVGR
jgi:hypothetical protein